MKTFSIMEAAVEPFRVAGRRPLATIVWGLLLLAPGVLVLGAMLPFFGEMVASGAFEPGADPDQIMFGDDFGAMMQFQLWSQLANLIQLFGVLLVTTAIIRSVFAGRRGDPALFLRIGASELYVAVVGVAIGVGFILIAILVALLAVSAGFAIWTLADPWRVLLCVALGFGVALGLLMLWGRLALLAPASIHHGTFAFEAGWKLGKGQTWRLLGLAIMMVLLSLVVGFAVLMLFFIVILAVGGGIQATDPAAVEAWVHGLPERPALIAGVAVVLLLPLAWLQGFSQMLFTAPYAHVVQALAGPKEGGEPKANSADTRSDAH